MRKRWILLPFSFLSLVLASSVSAAPSPFAPCKPCAGLRTTDPHAAAASLAQGWKPAGHPRLYVAWRAELDGSGSATAASEVRAAGATPWLSVTFRTAAPLATHLDGLGRELGALAELTKGLGPAAAVQILWEPVGADAAAASTAAAGPAEYAFLLKRAAVAVTGADPEARVVTAAQPADSEALRALYREEIAAYVEAIALRPAPAAALAAAFATLAELDPGKPAIVDALPYPALAAEALALAAEQASAGAALTLFETTDPAADLRPLKLLAAQFQGDISADPNSAPSGAAGSWAFVRGSDLGLRVVARGNASSGLNAGAAAASEMVLRFPDPTLTRIVRIDPATGAEVPLGGRRVEGGIEVHVRGVGPVVLLSLDRTAPSEKESVKERVEVTSQAQMPVEEILRRLQAFEDAQSRRLQRYSAVNTTSLRFPVGGGVQSVEATFRGPYFFEQGKPSDWVWKDLLLNGVRWRGKSIPEIPLIQPEKAAAMPLEISFSKEYRYSLRGHEELLGRDCWVVDFAPLGSPEGKRLYRGSVWVDRRIYARVRTRAVQLGLTGEVLSNEETLTYTPVDVNGQPAAWDPTSFVLPLEVRGEQTLSVVNRVTLVEKDTRLTELHLNPTDFEAQRQAALDSEATMVRDTDKGLRYLEKDKASGGRVVREGFAKSKLFALGGLFYEKSLDYPLPLAGINYFSLDFKGTGDQVNLFFGGALFTLNVANPQFLGTRFDAGIDAFALAVPFSDKVFDNGKEAPAQEIKSRSALVAFNLGHPLGSFAKLDFTYRALYSHYQKGDNTAADFVLPADHVTHQFDLSSTINRGGYRLSLGGIYSKRSKWDPWGLPGNPDFDPKLRDYTKWAAGLRKTWAFKGFQRFSAEVDYDGGQHLDRFSKYQFGFFGDSRVHGYQSDEVRASKLWAGHLNYGFGVGETFRIDLIGDAALATDRATGLHNKLLAGTGIAGTFIGPWQTVVNLDLGTPVAGPDRGFVAYIVFLKLFK